MIEIDPYAFSREWEDCWNRRDLEGILRYFHDDATFTSPLAARLMDASDGVLRGKSALRAYWTEGLKRNPDLKFAIDEVFAGIDTIVILFRDQNGVRRSEVLTFAGNRICVGHGTYPIRMETHAQ